MTVTPAEEHTASGWITFAGVLFLVVAVINIIGGISAIGDSKFWVGDAKYILSGLNGWGWFLLTTGVVQLLVAFGLWAGQQWARWAGVFFVCLNMIGQTYFISANPTWTLFVFILDLLILYGLIAHGARGRVVVT